MPYHSLIPSSKNIGWTLTWYRDTNSGDLGFTIYGENHSELYKRNVSHASEGDNGIISVSSEIKKIKFNGGSDGFHGHFEVRDPNGHLRLLECIGCESTSTSLLLGSFYIDSDLSSPATQPDTAYCRDDCIFELTELIITTTTTTR